MIKTVVFDIGQVLVDFAWEEVLRKVAPEETLYERLARATVLNPVWNEYDRGIWTIEEVEDAFVKCDPEIESYIRSAVDRVGEMIRMRDYAISWIRDLKEQGLRVLILSNYGKKAYRESIEALRFLPETDGGILSYRVGLIKPDPAIYRELFRMFQLVPEECVFIDDRKENILAARQQGMQGIVFESYEQAHDELFTILAK